MTVEATHLRPVTDAESITVVPWRISAPSDSIPTHSNEMLMAWAPVLGPTSVLLAHRLAMTAERSGRTVFTLTELADAFGVTSGKIAKAIKRLHRHKVAKVDAATVAIRLSLPPSPDGTRHRTALVPEASERQTVSVSEAAAILGISRGAAYNAAHSGVLPVVRFGGRILVPRAKLDELIEGR
jgi:excisionase family DNA binding protein